MEEAKDDKNVHQDNSHIEIWKIRKLIQKLDTVKGYPKLIYIFTNLFSIRNGTSFVSLVVPQKDDIGIISRKLA